MKKSFLLFSLCLLLLETQAQATFELQWEYPYESQSSPLSLLADVLDRPYVYVASNEEGLVILSTSGNFVASLPVAEIGAGVMNLTQSGNLLYVAIGSHFNSDDPPGLAIVDVSDPETPEILDIWQHPNPGDSNGTGIVKVVDGYAYLGAMSLGLIILNVADPNAISFVSELPLDINYPVQNPTPTLYNARGMEVRDDLVYMCFDAGGLRVIDCTDKLNPEEIGHYANPVTYDPINWPRAYNNVVLVDDVAYVAVDYCGIEALDISDPENIELLDHYNLQNCPAGLWYNSVLHTNEIFHQKACNKLFVASGRSELLAFDISQPGILDSVGMYGMLEDTMATWGISMRHDSIYLSYLLIPIYIPLIHPFDAKWNGVKMVKWIDPCMPLSANEGDEKLLDVIISPNPTTGIIHLQFPTFHENEEATIFIYNAVGQLINKEKFNITSELDWQLEGPNGIYFMHIRTKEKAGIFKIIKTDLNSQ